MKSFNTLQSICLTLTASLQEISDTTVAMLLLVLLAWLGGAGAGWWENTTIYQVYPLSYQVRKVKVPGVPSQLAGQRR